MNPPKLLTSKETCARLGLKTATNHALRKLELRGLLHPIRLSARTLRYDIRDIEKMIEDARAG